MTFEEMPDPPKSKTPVVVAAAVLIAVALGALWLRLGSPDKQPAPAPAPSAAATPAPPPAPAVVATAPVAETPAARPAARVPAARKRAPKAAPAPASPAAPALVLKIDSDVPGASVFVDRRYLGTTPLTTSDVTPGAHTLNVSAPGYDGYSSAIDVGAGTSDVMVRFKEVRLNEAIPVTHKHAVGSCTGRLAADVNGIRYESSNKSDSFVIPFSQVESFEVDYLKKNLRLKRRGGKTYNFTDDNANADALFVFHKKVQAAREKLARGTSGS